MADGLVEHAATVGAIGLSGGVGVEAGDGLAVGFAVEFEDGAESAPGITIFPPEDPAAGCPACADEVFEFPLGVTTALDSDVVAVPVI